MECHEVLFFGFTGNCVLTKLSVCTIFSKNKTTIHRRLPGPLHIPSSKWNLVLHPKKVTLKSALFACDKMPPCPVASIPVQMQNFKNVSLLFSHFLRTIKVQKMLPLTDGAGYKLFSASNVPAYRWCGI